MFPSIERVYVNDRARHDLGWSPRRDFAFALDRLRRGFAGDNGPAATHFNRILADFTASTQREPPIPAGSPLDHVPHSNRSSS